MTTWVYDIGRTLHPLRLDGQTGTRTTGSARFPCVDCGQVSGE